jgi:hypothetical protein
MYCSIRHYRTRPGQLEEILHLVDDELADRLSREPGFVQYHLIAGTDGEACTITLFEDEDGARRSSELAAEFTREKLAGFDVTPTTALAGKVRVIRARPEPLKPTRA